MSCLSDLLVFFLYKKLVFWCIIITLAPRRGVHPVPILAMIMIIIIVIPSRFPFFGIRYFVISGLHCVVCIATHYLPRRVCFDVGSDKSAVSLANVRGSLEMVFSRRKLHLLFGPKHVNTGFFFFFIKIYV